MGARLAMASNSRPCLPQLSRQCLPHRWLWQLRGPTRFSASMTVAKLSSLSCCSPVLGLFTSTGHHLLKMERKISLILTTDVAEQAGTNSMEYEHSQKGIGGQNSSTMY